MEAMKFVLIGLCGAILVLALKGTRPELALVAAISTGALLLLLALDGMSQLITYVGKVTRDYGLSWEYIGIALKIAGVSMLCDFGASVCKDAGEGSIASKVELGGKIAVIALALPIIDQLLTMVDSLLKA